MGKDLNGKELGPGIRQRKNGSYDARFVNRFGVRKELVDKDLKNLQRRFTEEKYKDEIGANVFNDKVTVSGWFNEWLETYKKDSVRASTYSRYRQVFYAYVDPILGMRKLDSIRNVDVESLLRDLKSSGYSYETRNFVRILLKDMYNKALINELAHRNPVIGVRVIRDKRVSVRFLTEEEQELFFRCSDGTFYHNLFVTAVCTGMRFGELAALTLDDIDFENSIIHVTKTLLYDKLDGDKKKTYHVDPPKTKTSTRDIPITERCMEALRDQVRLKGVVAQKTSNRTLSGFSDLLFVTKFNTPLNTQDVTQAIRSILRMVNETLDESEKIERFSFHCFRHTFATRCFELGIEPKIVQGLLGHAHLSMTMDLYTHVTEKKTKEELEKLEGVHIQ